MLLRIVEDEDASLFQSTVPLIFKEDVSLYNFATTKSDKKKHISRIPTD